MNTRRALLTAALVVSVLLVAADLGLQHYGVPSDEEAYAEASRLHMGWFATWGEPGWLSEETLNKHFASNPAVVVHPAFSRLASGATWALFHRGLGVDERVSLRLHNALAYGLIGLGLVGFVLSRFGAPTALVALLLFWANIRLFGHAHTAMPDLMLSCTWLWATLLVAEAVRRDRWRVGLLAAVVAGLALATKLTGVLLVGLLVGWTALFHAKRAPRTLVLLTVVPPLIFLMLSPQAWHHLLAWTGAFLTRFGAREETVRIPTWFLGELYTHRVPWYVPSVHLLITTAPALLLLTGAAAIGGVRELAARGWTGVRSFLDGPAGLCVAAGVLPLAASSAPSIPSHDVERLFLPIQPFLVLWAAYGFWRLSRFDWTRALPPKVARFALPLVAAALCLPSLVEAARQHPYQLSYFNGLVGGASGAKELGFDVVYLKTEANASVLAALNERVGEGGSVYSNFLQLDLELHQRAGRLRADIQLSRRPTDWVLLHARRSWMSQLEVLIYESDVPPVWSIRHGGVDLVALYDLAALQAVFAQLPGD